MGSWNSKLAVGNAAIDEQHRALFEHADGLLEAMRQHRAPAEVATLLLFLRDYCRSHFAMEEGIMAANLYPHREGHAAQHREFERRFKVIEEHIAERGPTALAILDLKDLIRGWLVSHIGSIDQRLADYLSGLPVHADPKRSHG
jgi:hemerythrin